MRLDTRPLSGGNFIDRLAADLLLRDSRWRYMQIDPDWRTRMCSVFKKIYNMKSFYGAQLRSRLKRLSLIPLSDGTWRSNSSDSEVYFATTANTPIPTDLGLNLVDPKAVENDAWADLLLHLGVQNCAPDIVVNAINKRYEPTNLPTKMTDQCVAHIRFLYWHLPLKQSSLSPQIHFGDQNNVLLRKGQCLYFPDITDEYSPAELFKKDDKLAAYPAHYLHRDYLSAVGPEAVHEGRSWTR